MQLLPHILICNSIKFCKIMFIKSMAAISHIVNSYPTIPIIFFYRQRGVRKKMSKKGHFLGSSQGNARQKKSICYNFKYYSRKYYLGLFVINWPWLIKWKDKFYENAIFPTSTTLYRTKIGIVGMHMLRWIIDKILKHRIPNNTKHV